jgi:hypothetical protein
MTGCLICGNQYKVVHFFGKMPIAKACLSREQFKNDIF